MKRSQASALSGFGGIPTLPAEYPQNFSHVVVVLISPSNSAANSHAFRSRAMRDQGASAEQGGGCCDPPTSRDSHHPASIIWRVSVIRAQMGPSRPAQKGRAGEWNRRAQRPARHTRARYPANNGTSGRFPRCPAAQIGNRCAMSHAAGYREPPENGRLHLPRAALPISRFAAHQISSGLLKKFLATSDEERVVAVVERQRDFETAVVGDLG